MGIVSLQNSKLNRNEKIEQLGNKILLESKLNKSLSNYSFEKEMTGDGQDKE